MIKLDTGNVLLKPSHRKQLMGWLKRATRLGERLGRFVVSITMHRTGKNFEIRAAVSNSQGMADFRARKNDWEGAMRQLVRALTQHLHDQTLASPA